MDESNVLKTSTELIIKTESVSLNGNNVPEENSTKPIPIKENPMNKMPEKNIPTANCYW